MPDGTLKEQERDNARDGILAALGEPPPAPAEPPSAAEAAGQPEEAGQPDGIEDPGEPEVPGAH
jgi:hypothetical protein